MNEKQFMRRVHAACDKLCKDISTKCIRKEKPRRSACTALNCGVYATELRKLWAEEDSAAQVGERHER